MGSTVTAQELDGTLSPTGKQYSYQTDSDLGTFSPTSTFGSQYIGMNASGYYFDEVANAISTGPVTLDGYSDLSATPTLNLNLLTTLAYQRIRNLVTKSGLTFSAAQTQAEGEVLSAFNIQNASVYGHFSSLDLSKGTEGSHVLVAISSVFVEGNTPGNLSSLIASVQSDIGANGAITSAATRSQLFAAGKNVNETAVAENLTQKYASAGVTFTGHDVSDWIDYDGDGLVGKFKFLVPNANQNSVFLFPSFVTDPYAGTAVSTSAGVLSVNGAPITGTATIKSGDVVSVAPGPSAFPIAGFSTYLLAGTTKIGRVDFVTLASNKWLRSPPMYAQRASASVTTLANAQVLIAGGENAAAGHLASAELYDPSTVAWSAAGSMSIARWSHIAVPLMSGKVLVAGGDGSSYSAVATAELFDPAANSWAPAANMTTAREGAAAALLPDGRVFVAGGDGIASGVDTSSTAEIYDPAANAWTPAASMATPRSNFTATPLGNGKVLVAGGTLGVTSNPAELYDASTNTWSAAGSMLNARNFHTATLLPSGKVLVVGGYNPGGLATVELYDPATNLWSPAASMANPRYAHTATLRRSGRVLVTGGTAGWPTQSSTATAELYDPSTDSWTTVASMTNERASHTATLLTDGSVLVCGGLAAGVVVSGSPIAVVASCETYW
jgi:hypothetical protein